MTDREARRQTKLFCPKCIFAWNATISIEAKINKLHCPLCHKQGLKEVSLC